MPKMPSERSYKPFSVAEPYPTITASPSASISSRGVLGTLNFSAPPLPPISTFPQLPSQTSSTLPPISSISSLPSLSSLPPSPLPPLPRVSAPSPHISAPPTSISSLLNPQSSPPRTFSIPVAPHSPPFQAPKAIKPVNTPRSRAKNDPLPWLAVEVPKLSRPDAKQYVPIYDDCNEIRRKIRAFFSNNNTEYKCTQKYFLEVIGNVNSNSYRRFMAAKGDGGGAENGTYTGAYVFFEKKRIWEGKSKGKKRLDSEAMTGPDRFKPASLRYDEDMKKILHERANLPYRLDSLASTV